MATKRQARIFQRNAARAASRKPLPAPDLDQTINVRINPKTMLCFPPGTPEDVIRKRIRLYAAKLAGAFFACLLALSAPAQDTLADALKDYTDLRIRTLEQRLPDLKLAGDYLKQASDQHYAGLLLTVVGGAAYYLGTMEGSPGIQGVGIAVTGTGIVFGLLSFGKVGKAGRTLRQKRP